MSWIDLHCDTLERMQRLGADPLGDAPELHVDLPRLERVGMRAAVWSVWVDEPFTGPAATAAALRMFSRAWALGARAADRLELVLDGAGLAKGLRGEKIALILGLEGATPLLGSLELLRAFFRLGLRVLTLTWNHDNPFASGCRAAGEADRGLTHRGRELIALARELGIVIDLAHASPRTLAAALEVLEEPFLVSHTACAALHAHRRNLSDAQLRMVARAGGVIGLSIYPGFLASGAAPVTLARFGDHLLHALDLVGEDALALGTDLDGITRLPEGFSGVADLPKIETELIARGLSQTTVEKIRWRNAARVLSAVLGDRTRRADDGG